MALIGADVHANGKRGHLIPRFHGYGPLRASYVRTYAVGPLFMAGTPAQGSAAKAVPARELLLGQRAQPAQGAVLGDPDRAG